MTPALIPPGVHGRVRGSLTVSIDEIFWCGNSPGEAYVKFSWWGSDDVYEFYPKDLTKVSHSGEDGATSYCFPVGTSMKFLENYFQKMSNLTFNVFRTSDKKLLGRSIVENWECVLSNDNYGSYFAILDQSGGRVGDLHVVFDLKFKSKKPKKSAMEVPIKSVESELLTDLLAKGQELREAMVRSALSGTKLEDLDEVVNQQKRPTSAPALSNDRSEAKLVDYLMGKVLSEPEKEAAINTLRCTSPADSILQMAAALTEPDSFTQHERESELNNDPEKKSFRSGKCRSAEPAQSRGNQLSERRLDIENINPVATVPAPSRQSSNFVKRIEGRKSVEMTFDGCKVTFGLLTLTGLGLKKVTTSPTIKPLNNKIRTAKSPGIVFSIETVLPLPQKSKAAYVKPVTLSSTAFGGNDVLFNGEVTRKFRSTKEDAWSKVGDWISESPVKIYWRCLNQRVPSLLGQCSFPEDFLAEEFESEVVLNVVTPNQQLAAKLTCKIELGANGLFGSELLGGSRPRKPLRPEVPRARLFEPPSSLGSSNSVKSAACGASKESNLDLFSFLPLPPPFQSRPLSTTSTNRPQTAESDRLVNAIADLSDKLSKRSISVDPVVDQPLQIPLGKSVANSTGSPERVCGGGKMSAKPSKGGCCCCCRGCQGDCKRRKSLRKKQSRAKKPLANRGSLVESDDSLLPSEGAMSPGERDLLSRHRSQFVPSSLHSPPTKLSHKSRTLAQASTYLPRLSEDSTVGLRGYDHSKDERTVEQSVHRFNVNVYSSDAHIFYREGELELYMVYRFPQVDPTTGKLFCPAEISSVELSGDSTPVVHHLPLQAPLAEALLAYPKHNITFHVWARAFLYEKRDFLIGQAKLPLEKLVEWEAAHNYSLKRRTDLPLLPPDKHFINLRIHPAKGELPQHLEPGRIAQLGLEIDYEKFQGNVDNLHKIDNLREDLRGPPRPTNSRADSSEPYLNPYERDIGREPPTRPSGLDRSRPNLDQWGVRMVADSYSDPSDLRLPTSDRADGRGGRIYNDEPNYLRVNSDNLNSRDGEEFMLILDNRDQPTSPSAEESGPRRPYRPEPPPRRQLEAEEATWGDEKLQYQSLGRLDSAKLTDFRPDRDAAARLLSPRIERDFPDGVQTADFSSDNNSEPLANPFHTAAPAHSQSKCHCADSETSPLPALVRLMNNRTEPENLDSSYELGSDSKATQTTVNEVSGIDVFSARVEVEAAINLLPLIDNGVQSKPSTRVEFDAWAKGRPILVQSSAVNSDSNPKYDSAWNVDLPAHFLYKGDTELELRVVNVEDGTVSSAYVDLTTISAGLPSIDGWYFLSSPGHKSAGQLKVTITPTENIRKYREIWIEECRQKKTSSSRSNEDRISCESAHRMMLNDSTTTKFTEKMNELEQLTQRMKMKLVNVERWIESPPSTLMRDVDHFAKQLIEEETTNDAPLNTNLLRPLLGETSDLPELDVETVQELCPVDESRSSDFVGSLRTSFSRIRQPLARFHARSIHPDRLVSDEFPTVVCQSPVDLISFDEMSQTSDTPFLLPQSNNTSPTSPDVVFDGGRFAFDSDGCSGGDRERPNMSRQYRNELGQTDSLDAASLAVEKMIAELRSQKRDPR